MSEELQADVTNGDEEDGGGFKFPTAYTVLFILLILVVIATWFIPAGQYELNEDGEPIPGSYHEVPQNPQRLIADTLLDAPNLPAPKYVRAIDEVVDGLKHGDSVGRDHTGQDRHGSGQNGIGIQLQHR